MAALCAWLGFYTTFNSYGEWDDEGYLLFSLKAFAHHGGLYTHIYSVFGPFYYEAFSTVFAWLPVTLDNGRVATLVVALLASLGFGAPSEYSRGVCSLVSPRRPAPSFCWFSPSSTVDAPVHPGVATARRGARRPGTGGTGTALSVRGAQTRGRNGADRGQHGGFHHDRLVVRGPGPGAADSGNTSFRVPPPPCCSWVCHFCS